MQRALKSWAASAACLVWFIALAGCISDGNGDGDGDGNGDGDGGVGNPIPGSCIGPAAGLPAPTAQLLFPTPDAEIEAGTVTFLWITGDASGDDLEVTLYLGDQPDVFDDPADTQTICARPNAEIGMTTAVLTATGTHYWGVDVTDGVTTVRRPADGIGIAFEVVQTQGARGDLSDAVLLCPRDTMPARNVTTFSWSLGDVVPVHTQVFVSRVGEPNPFDNALRVFEVEPPTQTSLAMNAAAALPLGEPLNWGLRIELADGVRFTLGGEFGADFTPMPNVPPSGALLGPADDARMSDGLQSFPLNWNADAGNCEDVLTGTVFLEFLGNATEPTALLEASRQIEAGPGALEINLVAALNDMDLDAGRWAWGVRASDGTDTTNLPDGADPARNFRTFIRDTSPRFLADPMIAARTCAAGAERDALVFDYTDDNGDATVNVMLFYAASAADVFSAPAASEALAPRDSGDAILVFLQTPSGGCDAFVHGAGIYGVELNDGVNAPVRRTIEYAPPTGACCLPSGACRTTLAEDCNGNFRGAGTTCATESCPAPPFVDCNTNGVNDADDIASGASTDCDGNGIPDECDGPLPTRFYVKSDADGANDGSSWENAFTELRDALADASDFPVDEIWVAAAEYRPGASSAQRFSSFGLIDGTAIYGGFVGGEVCLSQRDPAANVTILSGDLDGDDDDVIVGTNSLNVVTSFSNNASAVLDGFTIRAGSADEGISAAFVQGAGIHITAGSPSIVGCRFESNVAASQGGAAYITGGGPTFSACTFVRNSAGADDFFFGEGGAVANDGGTPQFVDCVFDTNFASGNGGGVLNLTGEIDIVGSTFIRNSAGSSGGGLAVYDGAATLAGCDFNSNGASNDGGAVMIIPFDRGIILAVNLAECTFTQNTAAFSGGAIANNSGQLSAAACAFADNLANGGDGGDGGAISSFGGGVDVRKSVFSRNVAVFGHGGAIRHVNGTMVLSGNMFEQNAAIGIEGGGDGGGVYASNVFDALVTSCGFTENEATDDGGGLYFTGTGLRVLDTEFHRNAAANDGGGVAFVGATEVSVVNALFVGNNAGSNGFDEGGAVAGLDSTWSLINSTVAENRGGAGGGLYVSGDSILTAANCIFWENQDNTGSSESAQVLINVGTEGLESVSYCIIQDLIDGGQFDTVTNVNNLSDDPLFVGPDNFRLAAGSPAIDSGNNDAVPEDVTTDLDGNPRFVDDPATVDTGDPPEGAPFVDRGAYEFQP